MKVRCFEKYFKNINALLNSTVKLCKQNSHRDKFRNRITENFRFYKFIASLAIIVTTLYVYYPLKSYFIDGERVPFLPIEIMFIDQSTLWGFYAASGIFITLGMYAIFGTEYMALSFVFVIMNYAPRVDILEEDFKELDVLWSNPSKSTLAYRHLFLKNICRKYVDMRE